MPLETKPSARKPLERKTGNLSGARPLPIVVDAGAVARLRGLARTVTRFHGAQEFAVLALGPPAEHRVSEFWMLSGQSITYGSFAVSDAEVARSVEAALAAFPELEIKGVGHRHPGTGAAAVYHSITDVEQIEQKMMPLLALGCIRSRVWRRRLELTTSGETSDLSAQHGRMKLTLSGAVGHRTTNPELALDLEVEETGSEVVSLVFCSEVQHWYCCQHSYRFQPTLLEAPIVTVSRNMKRSEPRVEFAVGGRRAGPGRTELEAIVRERIIGASNAGSAVRFASGSGQSTDAGAGSQHAGSPHYGGWESRDGDPHAVGTRGHDLRPGEGEGAAPHHLPPQSLVEALQDARLAIAEAKAFLSRGHDWRRAHLEQAERSLTRLSGLREAGGRLS